jgi:hypothetical protein
MVDLDYLVAIGVTPCKRGHTLRKKSGHCVQCSPSNLGYEARYDAAGEVYVAYSTKANLTKIGSVASSIPRRIDQLNSYRYGSVSDWKLHWSYKCDHAGRVESEAHKSLHSFRAEGSYFKNGSEIVCREIFSCSLIEAMKAVTMAAGIEVTPTEQWGLHERIPISPRNALTIAKLARELGVPAGSLLAHLHAAGVDKSSPEQNLSDAEKLRLFDHLRQVHRSAVNVAHSVVSDKSIICKPEIAVPPPAQIRKPLPERYASKTFRAAPLVCGISFPAKPTRMLSNTNVYEGWECRSVARHARTIVAAQTFLTLRELHERLKLDETKGKIAYPFVWWIYVAHPPIQRAIHQDIDGNFFVKLGSKWQLAYSIDHVGTLAGAQGGAGDYDIPKTGYFVIWENEAKAVRHA